MTQELWSRLTLNKNDYLNSTNFEKVNGIREFYISKSLSHILTICCKRISVQQL